MDEKFPAFSGSDGVCLKSSGHLLRERGLDLLTGGAPDALGELVKGKYHLFFVSRPDSVPVVTNCSTGRTEQVDQNCWF